MKSDSLWTLGLTTALFLTAATALLADEPGPATLRLATTTSTDDSGLLKAILPDFEARYKTKVRVIAVGTGQALKIAASGDADVVLVHARQKEDQFVSEGHGTSRRDVMYNDFIIVGPGADPAKVAGMKSAREAFTAIAERKTAFVSRGDESGTHTREKEVWASAGLTPAVSSGWYYSIGQGMGETLLFAEEKGAYTLTDRGTYLARRSGLPGLTVLVGGDSVAVNPDPLLRNPYGIIPVNPARHPGVHFDLASRFADWITSEKIQRVISAFGTDRFGQPLFYPDAIKSNKIEN